MLQLFENGRNFGLFPTMFPLDGFWCGFGRFPTIYCVCWKTAEISAVFQQCLFSKDLGTVSAVFQQFQPLFFMGGKKTAEILTIFLLPQVFRPFSNNGFWPFSNKFLAILQLIAKTAIFRASQAIAHAARTIQNHTTPFRLHSYSVSSCRFSSKSAPFCYHLFTANPNGGYHPTQAGSAKSLSVGPSGPKK